MVYQRVCILGVGLIGGSIGIALKQRNLARSVVGVGRHPEKLETAISLGAIDQFASSVEVGAADADLIIACTPVQTIPGQLQVAAGVAHPNALLTDVGSTKRTIVEEVQRRNLARPFIGSHPMAGSALSGVEHASPDLFVERLAIVTPISSDAESHSLQLEAFWQSLGAKTLRMTPESHDEAVARVSHLPHIVAAALARMTPPSLLPIAASGWASTTRVAAGDPELWRQIIEENRDSILASMKDYASQWSLWEQAIQKGDSMELVHLLQESQAIQKQHSLVAIKPPSNR